MIKLPKFEFSPAKLKEFLFERHRFWVILITIFCASQVINIWASMPDFAQWDFVFGFPFAYLYWKNADGFIYANILVLLVDLLIVFLAFRAFLYARYQIYKFEIPKDAKEVNKKKDAGEQQKKEKNGKEEKEESEQEDAAEEDEGEKESSS
ncbi:MAG: hypothetical protein V1813_00875 [Candidatus Aenigmatarchaeota archaeon]